MLERMKKGHVAVLCTSAVLAASSWMVQLAFPSSLPDAEAEILVFLLIMVGAWTSGPRWRGSNRRSVGQAIGSGLLLFGLPLFLLDASVGALPALTQVAVLALVPTVMVVIATARETGGGDFLGPLSASLAGVAGAFLLLPVDPVLLLHRPWAGMLLAVEIVSIALGSYGAYAAAKHMQVRELILVMVGPSLVLAGVVGLFRHTGLVVPTGQDVPGLVLRATEMLLLVYLIRVMSPVALAARYLLVPLITAVEGFVYLRPQVSWRPVLGMLLLAFSSWRLLKQGGSREEPRMSLL